ncbi:hypothetical protein [Enterococcus sp. AZ128]
MGDRIEQSEEFEPLLPDEHFQLLFEELRNLKKNMRIEKNIGQK